VRGLALPLLAALLLHGLGLALAGNRVPPRQRSLPTPPDDTPELLRLSRAAELAATPPSSGSRPLPAVPALPPPARAASAPVTKPPAVRASSASGTPTARLNQLQAQAVALGRLWEQATPVTGGLPAGVERRRLPAALARAGGASHGSAVPVPGGLLLVWHGGGGVWLLRAPLKAAEATGGSAAGEGRAAGEQPAQGLRQGGGAEHPVAEPQHDPPGD
jgi:hypothetical protein